MRFKLSVLSVVLSLPLLLLSCGSEDDLLLPTGPPPLTDMEDPPDLLQWGPCFDMTVDEFDIRVAPYLQGEEPPELIPLSYEFDEAIDSVSVCYDYMLDVTVTASTSLVRDYTWDVEIRAAQGELTLAPGQLYLLPYTVEVIAAAVDRNWGVSGSILIANDSPYKATVTGVYDGIHGIPAATFCGRHLPYTLRPGEEMTCIYQRFLPGDVPGVSRVVVATQGRVGPGYASKGFDFSDPFVHVNDECVRVYDQATGQLGQVCGEGAVFELSAYVGGFEQCGLYLWRNEASIEAAQWRKMDVWTVLIDVPCGIACTLGQGYWSTHSAAGPAPYDDAWAELPKGAETPFFAGGASYGDMLWDDSRTGNAYVILARAYIAAELSGLNGASFDAIAYPFIEAGALLAASTPEAIDELAGDDPLRRQFLAMADVLEDYVEGVTGPGACDQEE